LPAAPEAAADAERATIDPQKIIAAAHSLSHGRDPFLVVEAAGGVGTPYGRRLLALDLAPMLDLPVVLVARATLGTVGQTLVALRALHAARIPCTGVVLCRLPGLPPGPEDHTNAPLIEAHAALVPVLGTLPLLEPPAPSPGDADAWRAWCEVHVADLEGSVDVSRVLEGPTPGNTD